jgi:prepilin-type N-terminal cleavage/methylation domain-containing protein
MRRLISGFHYSDKGFTLVEVLVVVAILGVLAGVAVPSVGRFIGTGRDEAMQTEFRNVQVAMHTGMVDNNMRTVSDY